MTRARERQVIAGITALATLCRLQAIFQPMRYDESVSWAYYIGRSFSTIAGSYQQPNNHVFFSLLSKLASAWADYAPWALRLPAFIAGTAIVPLVWLVGRRFADPRTALVAAALVAGSPSLVLYSTNARGYSFIVAFFLALLVVVDQLRMEPSRGLWVCYSLICALGLYTVPVMMYPIGVVAVWLLLAVPDRRTAIALCVWTFAAVVLAGLLYSPIILSSGMGVLIGNKFVTPSTWETFVIALPSMFVSTYASWTIPLPLWIAVLILLISLVGIRKPSGDRPPVVFAVLPWCGFLLVAMHRVPYDRVWLFLQPLFLLAVARGLFVILDRVTKRSVSGTLVAVSVALTAVGAEMLSHAAEESDDTGPFRDAEQVAHLLAPRLISSDRVLAPIPAIGPLLYYFPRANADTALLTVPLERVKRAFLVLDSNRHQDLAWAVERRLIDPADFTEPVLVAKLRGSTVWETHRR